MEEKKKSQSEKSFWARTRFNAVLSGLRFVSRALDNEHGHKINFFIDFVSMLPSQRVYISLRKVFFSDEGFAWSMATKPLTTRKKSDRKFYYPRSKTVKAWYLYIEKMAKSSPCPEWNEYFQTSGFKWRVELLLKFPPLQIKLLWLMEMASSFTLEQFSYDEICRKSSLSHVLIAKWPGLTNNTWRDPE